MALEVTSHALMQHRLDGYRHDVAVFTNLSQDHLDYHGTMEAYFAAKARLFTPEHARQAVVNADDPFGQQLLAEASIPTGSFSLAEADELEVGLEESHFRLAGEPVRVRPGGEINVRNALAAAAAARAMDVPAATIAAGLSAAEAPSGRLEPVANDLGLEIVVDYAHTPAGLAEILAAAHAEAERHRGRVLVVFGCGGDRDRAKRPIMGSVATHLADVAVLTSDNPRDEDPLAIIREVWTGCDGSATYRRTGSTARDSDRPSARRWRVTWSLSPARDTRRSKRSGTALWRSTTAPSSSRNWRERSRGRRMIPLLSAGAVSILVAGFGTPILLRWLIRWRIGQQIRVDGPAHHTLKAGTPTMGGIAILIASSPVTASGTWGRPLRSRARLCSCLPPSSPPVPSGRPMTG